MLLSNSSLAHWLELVVHIRLNISVHAPLVWPFCWTSTIHLIVNIYTQSALFFKLGLVMELGVSRFGAHLLDSRFSIGRLY